MNIVSESIEYTSFIGWIIMMSMFASILFWLVFSSYKDNKKNPYPSAKPMMVVGSIGIILCLAVAYKYTVYSPEKIIKAEIHEVDEVYDRGYEIVGRDGELFIIRKNR